MTTSTWIIGIDSSACSDHRGLPSYTGPFSSREDAVDYIDARHSAHTGCFNIMLVAPPIGTTPIYATGGIIPTAALDPAPWPTREQLRTYLNDTFGWTHHTAHPDGDVYRYYNAATKTEFHLLLDAYTTDIESERVINDIRNTTGLKRTNREIADSIMRTYPTGTPPRLPKPPTTTPTTEHSHPLTKTDPANPFTTPWPNRQQIDDYLRSSPLYTYSHETTHGDVYRIHKPNSPYNDSHLTLQHTINDLDAERTCSTLAMLLGGAATSDTVGNAIQRAYPRRGSAPTTPPRRPYQLGDIVRIKDIEHYALSNHNGTIVDISATGQYHTIEFTPDDNDHLNTSIEGIYTVEQNRIHHVQWRDNPAPPPKAPEPIIFRPRT